MIKISDEFENVQKFYHDKCLSNSLSENPYFNHPEEGVAFLETMNGNRENTDDQQSLLSRCLLSDQGQIW